MQPFRYFRLFAAILMLSLALGACSPAATPVTPTLVPATTAPTEVPIVPTDVPAATPTATSTSIDLVDGLGNDIKLETPAQRVVSLAPSNSEILYAVGAGSQVVGRDEFSDYPSQVSDLPSVGGSNGQFDLEAIVQLKPDLVLASSLETAEQVKSIQNLGLTVYYLANPTDLDSMYTNLVTVGKLTGHEADAQALVSSLQQRVQVVEDKLANIQTHPIVFYELDATDPTKPYTAGPGSYIDTLITMAGGKNAGAQLGEQWAQLSLEQVVAINPDLILLGDGAYGVTSDMVTQRAGWGSIKAVQNKQIYTFDDNLVSRPTNRMVDGLELLAKLIHPEAFQ